MDGERRAEGMCRVRSVNETRDMCCGPKCMPCVENECPHRKHWDRLTLRRSRAPQMWVPMTVANWASSETGLQCDALNFTQNDYRIFVIFHRKFIDHMKMTVSRGLTD